MRRPSEPARAVESLFDAVLAGDEDAFAVLLDHWRSYDPPRAEFGRLDAAQNLFEAAALLHQHRSRWAGVALADPRNHVGFERALPRTLDVSVAEPLAAASNDPGTTTLRAIWASGTSALAPADAWRTFLANAPLRHLRELRVAPSALDGVDNPSLHLDEVHFVPDDERYAPVPRCTRALRAVRRVVVTEVEPNDLDALRALQVPEVTLDRRLGSPSPERSWFEGWPEAVRQIEMRRSMPSSSRRDLALNRRDDGGWAVVLCRDTSWVYWYEWVPDLPADRPDAPGIYFVGPRMPEAEPARITFFDALPPSDVAIDFDVEDVQPRLRRTLEWLERRPHVPRAWIRDWGCLSRTDGRALDHLAVYGHVHRHEAGQLVTYLELFVPGLRALTLVGPFSDETEARCASWCDAHGVSFARREGTYPNLGVHG